MRYCLHCGMPLEDDDRFCVRCGKPVAGGDSAPAGEMSENRPGHMEPGLHKKKQGSLEPFAEREAQTDGDQTVTVVKDARGVDPAPAVSPGGSGSAAAKSAAAKSGAEKSAAAKSAAASDKAAPEGTGTGSRSRRPKMGYASSRAAREQEAQRRMALILFFVCLILAGTLLILLLRPGRSTPETGAGSAAGAPAAEAEAVPADSADQEEARLEQERQEAERKAAEEAEQKAAEEAAEAERRAEEEARKKAEEEAAKKAAEEEAARKAAEEEAARKAAAADGAYILADSSSRAYSYEELNQLDDYTLQMAINEIYARHGRKFDTPEIQEYFNKKSWYKGTIAPKDFDGKEGSYFNQYEQSNRELMARIRDERAAAAGGEDGQN